jgi:hypothetical protein
MDEKDEEITHFCIITKKLKNRGIPAKSGIRHTQVPEARDTGVRSLTLRFIGTI